MASAAGVSSLTMTQVHRENTINPLKEKNEIIEKIQVHRNPLKLTITPTATYVRINNRIRSTPETGVTTGLQHNLSTK